MTKKLLILLLISSSCFSQFKLNYKEIQDKYPIDSTQVKDGYILKSRTLKDSTIVAYYFNKDTEVLTDIVLYKISGLSKKEVDDFQHEYVVDFKPTRWKENAENLSIYYDEDRDMMMFNYFTELDHKKLVNVSFTIDKKTIKTFIDLMNKGY